MRRFKFVSVFVLLALLLSAGPGAVTADEPPPDTPPDSRSLWNDLRAQRHRSI